jgi:hypothetical protein
MEPYYLSITDLHLHYSLALKEENEKLTILMTKL